MDWNNLGKKLLYPPIKLMLTLTIISTTLLVLIFKNNLEQMPIAYITYVVSFYTLTTLCIFLSLKLPKQYIYIKQKLHNNPFGNRYITDVTFKTHVSLYITFAFNILYALINLISGIWFTSVWFITLAVYYIVLATMRFLLLRFVNINGIGKNRIQELRRSQLCSFILLTLNIALTGVVILVIKKDAGFEYPGILIYLMALYTFYITIYSMINIIKYRKYQSPVMSNAKSISLATSLVSMLSLETAMLAEFGTDTPKTTKTILIIATGAGVSIIIITISLYNIFITNREINKKKRNKYE